MVLEEATNPSAASDTLADNPDPSSPDPYASSSDAPNGPAQIRLDTLPRVIPFIGPLLGFNNAGIAKRANEQVERAALLVRRPLTQDETDVVAYHSARIRSVTSYAGAGGMAAGLYRCHQTRAEFRLPFFNPMRVLEKFNPDEFLWFKGEQARMVLTGIRTGSWACIGLALGMTAGSVLAATWSSASVQNDDRFKAMFKEFRNPQNQQRLQRMKEQKGDEARARPSVEQATARTGRAGQDQQQGAEAGSTDVLSDPQMRGFEERLEAVLTRNSGSSSSPSQTQTRRTGFQRPSPPPKPQSDFDDASPTGGLGPMDDMTGPEKDSAPSGSAWARLRQQAAGGQKEQRSGSGSGSGNGASLGDSFSFSSSDEERQLAKAEAQREFDARVERERAGKDFSEERRW